MSSVAALSAAANRLAERGCWVWHTAPLVLAVWPGRCHGHCCLVGTAGAPQLAALQFLLQTPPAPEYDNPQPEQHSSWSCCHTWETELISSLFQHENCKQGNSQQGKPVEVWKIQFQIIGPFCEFNLSFHSSDALLLSLSFTTSCLHFTWNLDYHQLTHFLRRSKCGEWVGNAD